MFFPNATLPAAEIAHTFVKLDAVSCRAITVALSPCHPNQCRQCDRNYQRKLPTACACVCVCACACDCPIGRDDLPRQTSPPGLNATKSRERFHPRTVSSLSLLRRSSVLGRTQLLSPSFSNARQRKHFARTRECSRVRCQREGFTCLIGGTLRSGAVGPASPSGHYVEAPAAALFPPFA